LGEGRTSALKASQKLDMLGIGMQHQNSPDGIAWRQNRDFENLLKRLNGESVDVGEAAPAGFHRAQEDGERDEPTAPGPSQDGDGGKKGGGKRQASEEAGESGEDRRERKRRRREEKARRKEERARRKTGKGTGEPSASRSTSPIVEELVDEQPTPAQAPILVRAPCVFLENVQGCRRISPMLCCQNSFTSHSICPYEAPRGEYAYSHVRNSWHPIVLYAIHADRCLLAHTRAIIIRHPGTFFGEAHNFRALRRRLFQGQTCCESGCKVNGAHAGDDIALG
jgi:hypothetical protein